MAIMQKCPECRKKHPYGEKCPNGCEKKKRKATNKHYDDNHRKNKDVYNSPLWRKIRKVAIQECKGIDLYELHKTGKVQDGTTVHHIIEVKDNKDICYDPNNLICVSPSNHIEIHEIYNRSEKDKERLQVDLKLILAKFKDEYGI